MSAQPLDVSFSESLPARFGRYVLLERAAIGGMAEIFLALRAEEIQVGRRPELVVVKRVLPELCRDPLFRRMFEREAAIAASLDHPNIARVFGFESVAGRQCIAMEHVIGVDVRQLVRLMRSEHARELPLDLSLSVVAQVCRGLDYAHAQTDEADRPIRIIHRDISPQNIMVGLDGVVRIVDFGVAQYLAVADPDATPSGRLKGKLPYMAPEQARGEACDHRSDLFSVGVVLFELTTGRRLFKRASDFETLKAVCEVNHPRPSQVNPDYCPELEAIVMKALAPSPGERFASGQAMSLAIEAFCAAKAMDIGGKSVARSMRKFTGKKLAADQARIRQRLSSLAKAPALCEPGDGDEAADIGDRRSHSTVRPIAATYHPPEVERSAFPVAVVATALAVGAAIGAVCARLAGP
jgi:serine/threonine-protein kinase